MVLLDEPVKDRLLARSPNLAKLKWPQLFEGRVDRSRVDRDRGWFFPQDEGIGRYLSNRGQLDQSRAMEEKKESPANHVPENTIGLYPIPGLAELP